MKLLVPAHPLSPAVAYSRHRANEQHLNDMLVLYGEGTFDCKPWAIGLKCDGMGGRRIADHMATDMQRVRLMRRVDAVVIMVGMCRIDMMGRHEG